MVWFPYCGNLNSIPQQEPNKRVVVGQSRTPPAFCRQRAHGAVADSIHHRRGSEELAGGTSGSPKALNQGGTLKGDPTIEPPCAP